MAVYTVHFIPSGADDPIWRLFPSAVPDGPRFWLYDQCAEAELLSRGTCSRRSSRDSLARLPGACRRGKSSDVAAVACENWCSPVRDSASSRFLFLRVTAGRKETESCALFDLRGCYHSCAERGHAGNRL